MVNKKKFGNTHEWKVSILNNDNQQRVISYTSWVSTEINALLPTKNEEKTVIEWPEVSDNFYDLKMILSSFPQGSIKLLIKSTESFDWCELCELRNAINQYQDGENKNVYATPSINNLQNLNDNSNKSKILCLLKDSTKESDPTDTLMYIIKEYWKEWIDIIFEEYGLFYVECVTSYSKPYLEYYSKKLLFSDTYTTFTSKIDSLELSKYFYKKAMNSCKKEWIILKIWWESKQICVTKTNIGIPINKTWFYINANSHVIEF